MRISQFCTHPLEMRSFGLIDSTNGTYKAAQSSAKEKLCMATHIRAVANSTQVVTQTKAILLYFDLLYNKINFVIIQIQDSHDNINYYKTMLPSYRNNWP